MNTNSGSKSVFLSMDGVESCQNVVRSICEATKHPANPLLPLGRVDEWDALQARPWESRTVLYDEQDKLFKCWYCGSDLSMERWWASGYAVSEDGVHWVKPRVGRIEYNGSKDNNIVWAGWGPVIKDNDEPDPARRYKAILKGPAPKEDYGIRLAYSPDGVDWTECEPFQLPEWKGRFPDIVVFRKDDQEPDPSRRYRIVWQAVGKADKPGPEMVRTKCIAFSADGENFAASKDNPFLHPNDGPEQENHFLMLAPWEGQWVLPYECGWYCPNGQGVYGQYLADIRLAVSDDGEHFRRVNPQQKLIPRGRHGQWDDGFLVISDKPVVKDDTIYLYYCGQGEDWTSWPDKVPTYRHASTGSVRLSRMGLATLRLDGWTCLETADGEIPGSATTTAIEATERAAELQVNVSRAQPLRSAMRVEVLDAATNAVLEGFARDDCRPVEVDGIRRPVVWKDRSLADVQAGSIKLRFCLYGAVRLHAYGFANS